MRTVAWWLLASIGSAAWPGAADPPRARFERVEGRVRIGVLLPQAGPHAREAREVRRGLQLALDALPAGAPPLDLLYLDDSQPWGAGSRQVVRLGFEEKTAAVIAGVEGAGAHLAEQIMTKALVPLLIPWSSDSSLTRINIPWMFQLAPDDEAQTAALLRAMEGVRVATWAVVCAGDFDSRRAGDTFARRAAARGRVVRLYFKGEHHLARVLDDLHRARPQAVFLAGPPDPVARLVEAARRGLPATRFLFPLSLFRDRLRRAAGPALQGSLFAGCAFREDGATSFHARYRQAFNDTATLPAAFAYDTLQTLAAALRGAPDRPALRDALQRTDRRGITGPLRFDEAGRRVGGVRVWTVQGGGWRQWEDAAG